MLFHLNAHPVILPGWALYVMFDTGFSLGHSHDMLKRLLIFVTATSLSLTFICPAMASSVPMDDAHHSPMAMSDTVDLPAPACCIGMNTTISQDRVAVETRSDIHIPNSIFQILSSTPCAIDAEAAHSRPYLDCRIRAPDPKFESSGLAKRE
jgi:hypothetical protein